MERNYQWKLFTIRKVAVSLHISLLFLLFYVFIVSTAQFPSVVKISGLDATKIADSPSLWGLLFTLSLILSIFIHEFSHVLMAQKHGGKVRRITLMMLGGVSEMEELQETPKVEFRVSVIGPLVSLAIGLFLQNLHYLIPGANLAFYGYWVGQLNIVLGVFNLIPAFPTDGGRILRAFLVSRQGQLKGTRNAIKVSNFFTLLFVLVGMLQFNMILMLIALFLFAASKNELFTLTAKEALKGLKARDLLVRVPSISEDSSLSQAAELMLHSRNLVLPVSSETKNYIIDGKDMARFPRKLWNQTAVLKAETSIPKAIDIDDPLENALKLSFASGLSSIPVLDHRKIIGMIRLSDLLEMIQLRQLAT